MIMYKQYKYLDGSVVNNAIIRVADNACIPFDPANMDYQAFKTQVNDGTAQIEDADGNIMTEQQAIDYVKGLP